MPVMGAAALIHRPYSHWFRYSHSIVPGGLLV